MAFQDFDLISERRKNERKQKLKKRIAIGVISTVVLGGLIAAAVFIVVSKNNDTKPSRSTPSSPSGSKQVSSSEKMVKMVCNSTDYKSKCEGTLNKAVDKDPKLQAKDLLEISIKTAEDEVTKAFNKVMNMKFDSKEAKRAIEDCKELMDDAKEELGLSASAVGSIGYSKLSSKVPDLQNWLSAVISYHETCTDGFADGKTKTDIEKLLVDSREFVSNSLAIVSKVASLVSLFQLNGASRHLLSEKPADGLPAWMNDEERRMLKAADDKPKPNVTVAQDGSGDYKTISEALAKIPDKYQGRYVVYVKGGVYDETVTVTKNMVNVTLYGDGSQKSIITGNKNFVDGVSTFKTASFVVLGDGFLGKAMGFKNTAGPEKHQAVAARVQADRAIFVNCRFEGYQDTLYAQTHRQFYRSCVIAGTIDFIFGDAAAVFQNCIMLLRKPMDNQQNIVTAQGRVDKHETSGIVLQKCEIKADDELIPSKDKIKSYLGRPWKEFSRTIVMESEIGDIINPDGWLPWEGDFALKTLYYAEYGNTGPGSSTNARVKWPGYKVINKQEATQFTVDTFLSGADWISGSGVPFQRGMYN